MSSFMISSIIYPNRRLPKDPSFDKTDNANEKEIIFKINISKYEKSNSIYNNCFCTLCMHSRRFARLRKKKISQS